MFVHEVPSPEQDKVVIEKMPLEYYEANEIGVAADIGSGTTLIEAAKSVTQPLVEAVKRAFGEPEVIIEAPFSDHAIDDYAIPLPPISQSDMPEEINVVFSLAYNEATHELPLAKTFQQVINAGGVIAEENLDQIPPAINGILTVDQGLVQIPGAAEVFEMRHIAAYTAD